MLNEDKDDILQETEDPHYTSFDEATASSFDKDVMFNKVLNRLQDEIIMKDIPQNSQKTKQKEIAVRKFMKLEDKFDSDGSLIDGKVSEELLEFHDLKQDTPNESSSPKLNDHKNQSHLVPNIRSHKFTSAIASPVISKYPNLPLINEELQITSKQDIIF